MSAATPVTADEPLGAGEPIISVRDASFTYGKQERAAVAHVNLNVFSGEKVAIVGESGSGKSTLARALVGLMAPSAGEVLVRGRRWSAVKRTDPERRAVQMVFQDPYSSLNPTMSPIDTVSEAFRVVRGQTRREARESALRALGDVGLVGEVLDRSPSGLSGGQLQRVSIARSLACAPQLLIADEATASLDVSAQQQIIQLLVELVKSREMSLVMISHDLHLTRSVADRVVVMRAGRMVEEGPTEHIFENPATEYTRDLLASAFLDA